MNDKKPSSTDSTDSEIPHRYAYLELDADTVIIYDREQTHAWIQSDVTVPTYAETTDSTGLESARRNEQRFAFVTSDRPGNGGRTDD